MTKIKICGITNIPDAVNSTDLGVEYLGFNFYPKSPRYVDPDTAKYITTQNRKGMFNVGVFVNENPDRINEIVKLVKLDLVQLHGDEPPEMIKEIRCEVIKAFQVKDNTVLEKIPQYDAHFILLDTFHPKLKGGTGETFDWEIAKEAVKLGKRTFLSGGLNPENIASAILNVHPYAVDICSGVEYSPGRKDIDKIAKLVDIVRSV
ncbi:MAG: phosphoribosylanthranilate isomerase [bacterium]